MYGPFDVSPPPVPPPTPKLTATLESGDEESARLTSTRRTRKPLSSVQLLFAHPDPQGRGLRVPRNAEGKILTYWKVDPAVSRQVAGAANILSAWKSARGTQGVPGPVPARGPSLPVRGQAAPSPPGPRAHVLGGRTRSARWSAGLAGGP